MKRILIYLGAAVAVLVIAAVALFASLFLGLGEIPDDFDMNGVRLVRDGFVGVGVIDLGPGEVALVDAGNDSAGTAVLAELERRGLEADAVRAVLLTHGHPDHIAALPLFPNAEVMAMAAERDLVAGRAAPNSPIGWVMPLNPTGMEVTRELRDGETVEAGETRIRAYAMPGHTAGSAAYLVNGVLFLGDEANASDDGEVMGTEWLLSEDVDEADASLVRLRERLREENAEVQAIVFAHSGVLTDGLAPLAAFVPR